MSAIRSLSSSDLPSLKESMAENNSKYDNENCIESSDPSFIQKTQTLDRFMRRPISQLGEKKKNFFASFRLNKRSFAKAKDGAYSGLEFSTSNSEDKSNENVPLIEGNEGDNRSTCNLKKQRERYLNRMSSFVSRVANKVQIGNDANSLLRVKLGRSQTVTGNDLTFDEVEYIQFENQVPGLMGIRNHGNTCFINAVIQCLSHTDILAEYFVLDHFKSDLARCNRINSKKYGSRGEITENLAILLKSLWVLRYVPDISRNLKNVVEKYEATYKGSNQHDAAEFLMFILDRVHEDLNTASKRKYKKIKNSYGRPDEIVAAETLANHLRCNSSFVQDIFQAQFRSSLKCPHCLKESNTFDPYLCVSIPIPQHEVLSIFVTVVYLNQQPKQVKIGVSIEATASIKQLRHVLSMDCGIAQDNLILTEIDGEGFHRTFADNACVNIMKSSDPIYAIEMHTQDEMGGQDNNAFIHIVWINVLLLDPDNIRFGGVYQSQVARDITYQDLQKLLLKEMSVIVSMETLIKQQDSGIFFIAVDNGSEDLIGLHPDLDLPFLHQSIEDCLSICHPLAGPPHIKLVLQWTRDTKEKYIMDDLDHVDEHSSVEDLKKKPPECTPVTLSDCLQLHTSAEMLSCGDAWHCPTCNRKQQVVKRLTLWSVPQVLVIHLKRFRQVSSSSNSSKLNTVVNFPLMGFDISEHMAGRDADADGKNNFNNCSTVGMGVGMSSMGAVWSSWRKSKKFCHSDWENVYDLFAICNHHGRDLQGGHYTAICRNPTNGKWYSFDDFNIEEISPENIVHQDAYILFYQRRESVSSLYGGDNSQGNHWSYKIPSNSLPPILKIIPDSANQPGTVSIDDNQSEKTSEADQPELTCELNLAEQHNGSTELKENTSEAEGASSEAKSEKATELCEGSQLDAKATDAETSASDNSTETSNRDTKKALLYPVDNVNTSSSETASLFSEKSTSFSDTMSCDLEKPSLSVSSRQVTSDAFSTDSFPSSVASKKSHERVPSFMMDTVDTRDLGSIQSLVETKKRLQEHGKSQRNLSEVPEVRIQPASLELLASHKSKTYPAAKHSAVSVPNNGSPRTAHNAKVSSLSRHEGVSYVSVSQETNCKSRDDLRPSAKHRMLSGERPSREGDGSNIHSSGQLRKNISFERVNQMYIDGNNHNRYPAVTKTPEICIKRRPCSSSRSHSAAESMEEVTRDYGSSRLMNSSVSKGRIRETYPPVTRNPATYCQYESRMKLTSASKCEGCSHKVGVDSNIQKGSGRKREYGWNGQAKNFGQRENRDLYDGNSGAHSQMNGHKAYHHQSGRTKNEKWFNNDGIKCNYWKDHLYHYNGESHGEKLPYCFLSETNNEKYLTESSV